MSGNNGHDNDTDIDIEIMTTFVRQIFEATKNVITSLDDGERISTGQLTQVVGEMLSRDAKDVLLFVKHFIHNTDLGYLGRGKNGGFIKGTKGQKVVANTGTTPDFNEQD